ncbi:MAG: transposase [Paucimonas sp.]|nr:transposase [Paucimonas sp.]
MFREQDDFVNFLSLLKDSAKVNEVAIHAYALLTNQILLLGSPGREESLSKMMQWAGRRYVPYFNRKYGRSGPLWGGRFRAAVVDGTSFFLAACQYVEESPVRAGVAGRAEDYAWSSCRIHMGSETSSLLIDHPSYWALGNTPFDREAAYRRALDQPLPASQLNLIEAGLRGGWVIGSQAFAENLQKHANRRITPGRRGRPPSAGAKKAPNRDDYVPD